MTALPNRPFQLLFLLVFLNFFIAEVTVAARPTGGFIQNSPAGTTGNSSADILIKFRPGMKATSIEALNKSTGGIQIHRLGRSNIYRIRIPKGIEKNKFIDRYLSNPNVEYVEPDLGVVLFRGNSEKPAPPAIQNFKRDHGMNWKIVLDSDSGLLRSMRGGTTLALPGTAEQAAAQLISGYKELFGKTTVLVPSSTAQSVTGSHIRFRQTYLGIPVRGTRVHFHFDKQNRLRAADARLVSGLTCSISPGTSIQQASITAVAQLPGGSGRVVSHSLSVDGNVPGGLLIWVLRLRSLDANREWEALVDAQTGQPISLRAVTVEIDGSGNVFDPNPVRRAEALALPIPTHGGDDCPLPASPPGDDLTPFQETLTLANLDGSGYLENSLVKIVNTVADGIPPLENYSGMQSTAFDPGFQFLYPYSDARFEEVNAYYHYERYRQYINNLGYTVLDNTPLIIDAHRANSFVGAAFTPADTIAGTLDRIFLGDKHLIAKDPDGVNDDSVCRELGESADPIIHEIGHVIRARIEPDLFYTAPSFEEGWADYLMASFHDDPVIGEWVDEGSFTGYRRNLNNSLTMADAQSVFSPFGSDSAAAHLNGQIWGGALWNIRQYILNLFPADPDAKELADTIVIEGMYNITSPPSVAGVPPTFVEGVDSLLAGLEMLQSLPSSDPLYDPRYQQISATLIRNEFTKKEIGANFPNDPRFNYYPVFPDTFTLHNTGVDGGLEDADIDAPEAWAIQTGRPDIVVGVTDSGINFYHEDMGYEDVNLNNTIDPGEDLNGNGTLDKGNIWSNPVELAGLPGIDDDNNGYVDDFVGWDFGEQDNNPDEIGLFGSHGTRVSSVIGIMGNNNIGLTGINWAVQLMPLKYSGGSNQSSATTEAVFYGADNGADVLNASWGLAPWYQWSQSLYEALRAAADTQVLFVTAAGNTGQSDGFGNTLNDDNDVLPIFPQSYILPNMINVTATNNQDQQLERFGKYSVDLAAPTGAPAVDIFNTYSAISQTSGAAPHVTGAIALLLAEEKDRIDANPGYRSMTMGEVRYLLLTSVDRLPQLVDLCVSEGRLNLHQLLLNYNDEDMDGFADRVERLFGTDPGNPGDFPDLNADADGDGLSNADELAYGTIPVVPVGEPLNELLYPIYLDANDNLLTTVSAQDSDGDGLLDGAEIDYSIAGGTPGYITDPANPDTDGDGLADNVDPDPSPNLGLPQIDPLDGAVLKFEPGIFTCLNGQGIPPDNCTSGREVLTGSYFAYDAFAPFGVFSTTERLAISPGPDKGVYLGALQPASGSHPGCPNGSENPGLDAAWCFFGQTGVFLTDSVITVVDPDVNNDGGFTKTLDFSGWALEWNSIPHDWGGDPAFADSGLATITCSQANCPLGSDFTLDYFTHGDPNVASLLGQNTYNAVHLEGTVANPQSILADGDINLDGIVDIADLLLGTRALIGAVTLTPDQLAHGDVAPLVSGIPNPDGQYTAGDLLVLHRKITGLATF